MSSFPILLSICVALVCGQKGYDRKSAVQSRYPAFQPRPSFSPSLTNYPSSYDSAYTSSYQPNYQANYQQNYQPSYQANYEPNYQSNSQSSYLGTNYGSGLDPLKSDKYSVGSSQYLTMDKSYYQPSITKRRAQILGKTDYFSQKRDPSYYG